MTLPETQNLSRCNRSPMETDTEMDSETESERSGVGVPPIEVKPSRGARQATISTAINCCFRVSLQP